jgi:tetratricopeptide (TPR) repeat protein
MSRIKAFSKKIRYNISMKLIVLYFILLILQVKAEEPDAYTHFLIAEKEAFNGNYETAIKEYNETIRLSNDTYVVARLSLLLIEQEKFKEAYEELKKIIDKKPDPLALKLYIELLILFNNKEEALVYSNYLIDINPNDMDSIKYYIFLLESNNKTDKAIFFIKEKIKEIPTDPFLYYYLAELYKDKKTTELEKLYIKSIELDNNFEPAINALINIYNELRAEEANKKLENLKNISFNNPKVLNQLATNYYMLGLKTNSKIYLKKAIENFLLINHEDYSTSSIEVRVAFIYEGLKEFNKAIYYFEKALEKRPDEEIIVHTASLYIKIKENIKAINLLEKALEINPENINTLNSLGYLYLENNMEFKKAKKLIEKAYHLEPKNPYILDSLGFLYYKEKNYQKAIFYLEEAKNILIKQNVIDELIIEHIIATYKKLNKENEINILYKEISSCSFYDSSIDKLFKK